jgi:hypothetical protein
MLNPEDEDGMVKAKNTPSKSKPTQEEKKSTEEGSTEEPASNLMDKE